MPQAITQEFGYGPYYESPVRRGLSQQRAIGQDLTRQQIVAITQGQLMAEYQDKARREAQEEQMGIQRGTLAETQKRTEILQEQQKAEEEAAKASGRIQMTTLGGVGGYYGAPAIGKLLGIAGGAAAGTAAGAGAGITAGTGAAGVAGMAAGETMGAGAGVAAGATTGAWLGPIGAIVGAGLGLAISKLSVICTELYHQGILDEETYLADSAFGKTLPSNVLLGYHVWAIPVVSLMRKSPLFTRLVAKLAVPWAKEIACRMGKRDKGTILGKIMLVTGIPLCGFIGNSITWITVSRKVPKLDNKKIIGMEA